VDPQNYARAGDEQLMLLWGKIAKRSASQKLRPKWTNTHQAHHPCTGCLLWLSCGGTSTELIHTWFRFGNPFWKTKVLYIVSMTDVWHKIICKRSSWDMGKKILFYICQSCWELNSQLVKKLFIVPTSGFLLQINNKRYTLDTCFSIVEILEKSKFETG